MNTRKFVFSNHPEALPAWLPASIAMRASAVKERELRRSNAALRYQNKKLENEVRRFTKMVYDEGLQLLTAARLAIAERGPIDEVQKLLERVEDQMIECSNSLWPRVVDDLGPRAALQSACRRFSRATGLEVKAEIGTLTVVAETGMALYKAVFEALDNIERHAQARRVTVWVYEKNSVVHCFVHDDGVGFNAAGVLAGMEHRASGLAVVEESLRSIGGTISIDSIPAKGTAITISIHSAKPNKKAHD
jgi:signal transduction histidine kinase